MVQHIIDSERMIRDVELDASITIIEQDNWHFMDYHWRYAGGREYLHNKVRYTDEAPYVRDKINTFDGDEMWFFEWRGSLDGSSPKKASARRTYLDEDMFNMIPSVTTTMGYLARHVGRQTLGESLLQAESLHVLPEPERVGGRWCYVLEALAIEHIKIKDWEINIDFKVWIDPGHDYRPLKWLMAYDYGTGKRWLARTQEVHDVVLKEYDGIWLPIESKRIWYANNLTKPEGMSEAQWKNLSDQERRVQGDLTNTPRQGGSRGNYLLRVDPASVRLNRGLTKADFRIKLPDGCIVWDDLEQRGYTVGEKPKAPSSTEVYADETEPTAPAKAEDAFSGGGSWITGRMLRIGAAVVIAVVAGLVWFMFRRREKASASDSK